MIVYVRKRNNLEQTNYCTISNSSSPLCDCDTPDEIFVSSPRLRACDTPKFSSGLMKIERSLAGFW